jgi:hypothetical protein
VDHALECPPKPCPGGYTLIMEGDHPPLEFCTLDLRHWQGKVSIPLRMTTHTRVWEILAALKVELALICWDTSQQILLAPDSREMVPCLLCASQIIAPARGPDAISTPVDTLVLFQAQCPIGPVGELFFSLSPQGDGQCSHCLRPACD